MWWRCVLVGREKRVVSCSNEAPVIFKGSVPSSIVFVGKVLMLLLLCVGEGYSYAQRCAVEGLRCVFLIFRK
jgi:hypothetical protein